MKKLIVLLALLFIISGCDREQNNGSTEVLQKEKESIKKSIEGTHWINDDYFLTGSLVSALTFSDTAVTLRITDKFQNTSFTHTGTYTYYPPKISIKIEGIFGGDDEPGTIDDDVLTINILSGDIIAPLEFVKQ